MAAMNPLPTVESVDDNCIEGCADYGATLEPSTPECEVDFLPLGDGEFVRCSACGYLHRVIE
jgi:hypothetical protein